MSARTWALLDWGFISPLGSCSSSGLGKGVLLDNPGGAGGREEKHGVLGLAGIFQKEL